MADGMQPVDVKAGDVGRSQMTVQERTQGQQSDQDGHHTPGERLEIHQCLHMSIIEEETEAGLMRSKPAPAGWQQVY
ncbi:hypothetical protein GCM10027399_31290 [Curvibacter fontanus]